MGLVIFVPFFLLKILYNFVPLKYFLNASNCWYKQNFEKCPTWPYLYFDVLSESCIGFVSFFIFLALELLSVSQELVFIENKTTYKIELCVTMWKRFTPTLATVWHKMFWQDSCLTENRNFGPSLESIITWKRDVLNLTFWYFS